MIQRIKNIISAKNMTSSGFADKVGVPRSTISHILSGRNKPSLELLQKILDAFPDIRTEWLVRGRGSMSAGVQTLFSQEGDLEKDEVGDKPADEDDNGREEGMGDAEKRMQTPVVGSEKRLAGDTERKDGIPSGTAGYGEAGKRMIKLVSLYDDGTFSVYLPSDQP